MEAVLVLLGALLAYLASIALQRIERRREGRAALYLQLLPVLEKRLTHYGHVAHQDRDGAIWMLGDNDWPYPRESDALYRQAVIVGRSDVLRAAEVRRRWRAFATMIDPELGSPSEQIVGDAKVALAIDEALEAVHRYSVWLERRFLRGRGAKDGSA